MKSTSDAFCLQKLLNVQNGETIFDNERDCKNVNALLLSVFVDCCLIDFLYVLI